MMFILIFMSLILFISYIVMIAYVEFVFNLKSLRITSMAGHFIVPLVILYFSIKSWFEMLGENEIKINAIKRVVLSLFYGMTFFIIGTSVTATWLVAYHSGKVHIKQPEYKQSSEEDNISFGFWKAADYLRQNKSIRFA